MILMHLIEIFLPLSNNHGKRFDSKLYQSLEHELTERFGGVTAFKRAPASGENKEGSQVVRDEIIILEVMTEELDRAWWADRRKQLEEMLDQDEILIRASEIEKL